MAKGKDRVRQMLEMHPDDAVVIIIEANLHSLVNALRDSGEYQDIYTHILQGLFQIEHSVKKQQGVDALFSIHNCILDAHSSRFFSPQVQEILVQIDAQVARLLGFSPEITDSFMAYYNQLRQQDPRKRAKTLNFLDVLLEEVDTRCFPLSIKDSGLLIGIRSLLEHLSFVPDRTDERVGLSNRISAILRRPRR